MERLNEFLRELLSSCSDELHLEPERNPYVQTANSTTDVANTPLLAAQITTMVFPLIPPDVRAVLPNRDEVEFVVPNSLGTFSFGIRKTPAGFNVTIRPAMGEQAPMVAAPPPPPAPVNSAPEPSFEFSEPSFANEPQFSQPSPVETMQPPPDAAPEYAPVTANLSIDGSQFNGHILESSSVGIEYTSQDAASPSLEEMLIAEEARAVEYDANARVEVVDVNDPQFQTVFSDTSTYEPPSRRDEFVVEPAVVSAPQFAPPVPKAAEFVPQHTAPAPPPVAYQPATYVQQESSFVPAAENSAARAAMDDLFRRMAEAGASDLHLSVSMPPMVRADGKMRRLADGDPVFTQERMREMLTSIMPAKNQEEFEQRHDTDFAYEIAELARFRCNVFMDRKGMGAVFRIIPTKILTAEQLGLSKAIMDLCTLSKGLVVVTGPTGSGKSTTLCAMVDAINKTREDHIITIEDPIEFVHDNQKCLVNQREVHNHTDSFKDALRAALREDPDILLVGEMRDLETISIAIETAETGHLVFGTLHTTTAASTVDRIIDQFPADRQQQIRVMLSESLKGVIAQTLLPKKGGGRVAALEVLIITPAISNLIREGKTFQIPSAIQTGKAQGMVMLNDALFEHVKNGLVEPRDAYLKAVDKSGFELMLTRAGFKI
jgi:twitching motility protein PilT